MTANSNDKTPTPLNGPVRQTLASVKSRQAFPQFLRDLADKFEAKMDYAVEAVVIIDLLGPNEKRFVEVQSLHDPAACVGLATRGQYLILAEEFTTA